MEETDIEQLCNGFDIEKITNILNNFIQTHEKSTVLPSLMENNRRIILWTALFQLLQRQDCQSVHTLCLASIRILSRDKTDLENLLCETWIKVLVERAGLYNFSEMGEESMESIELPDKLVCVEALKCLCNITFNSEMARAYCAETDIAQSIVARLRIYQDIPFKDDVMVYDMKLIFILTAMRQDIRAKIKELHGMDYLTSCLNEIILEASTVAENASCSSGVEYFLPDTKHTITCDILKAQFNLILTTGIDEVVSETEEAMYLKLMPILTALLYTHSTDDKKMFELHDNISNLLTSVPSMFYTYLTPLLNEKESAQYIYDGRNMDALQSLVNLLQHKLTVTQSTASQYENLSPILTVMNKCARGCRSQRKYLRQAVLPPLRDVSHPPEKGTALRNQLCRLLTTHVTAIRDLVAEFLFILCKEKVGRMVKYTGFGNAAGHLAQKGLLGGVRSGQYSSSSDDSDTEEYLEAQPNIDPVVGCTRPPRVNPFEGMTEEQKEYEAMKLVNLFDAMVTRGVVRPARIGPDGRPQPVDHVLQLRDEPPNRPQS